jgi:hypothetical protein
VILLDHPANELDTWENEGGAIANRPAPFTLHTHLAIPPIRPSTQTDEVDVCRINRNHPTAAPEDTISRVRYWLTNIPDLLAEQPEYLIPGSIPADPSTRYAPTSPARPPVNLTVIDLTDTREKDSAELTPAELLSYDRTAGYHRLGVLPTLGLWVSLVLDELIDLGENPDTCCPLNGQDTATHTITGEVGWLIRYLPTILDMHPDFATDIEAIHRDLRHGQRDTRDLLAQLKCPKCRWPVEAKTGNAWLRCTGCDAAWTMAAEIRRFGATQPDMPLAKIAGILGRPLDTLRKWSIEGRILPVGRRGQTFLYDVERVRRVSEETAKRVRK